MGQARDAQELARLARKLKALAHPNRLRLFSEILAAHPVDVERGHTCFLQTIMQHLRVTAPTVSHHLKELVDAGLITTALEGKRLTCTVSEGALDELEAFLARARGKASRR